MAQDRLVKGPRVAGAATIEQANAYLESEFLPWWNATLRVRPALPDKAHGPLGPEHDPGSVLSHDEARRVANDYTIRIRGRLYQIDRKAIVPRRPRATPQAVESPYRDRPNDQPLRNHRG